MKKKVVSVLMAAAMVAGMAGCGSSNTGNAGTTNSNASTNNEAPQRAVMLPQAQQQILMLRNQKRSPLW